MPTYSAVVKDKYLIQASIQVDIKAEYYMVKHLIRVFRSGVFSIPIGGVNFCHLHPTYYISTHLLYELDL